MGRFRSLVGTPKGLTTYRANFGNLDNIRVCYFLDGEVDFRRGIETVIIPLVAIVEGGARILMSKLLTNFLRYFKICLEQVRRKYF